MLVTDFDLYEESIDVEINDSMLTTITLLEFQKFLAFTLRLEVWEECANGSGYKKSPAMSMQEYWQLDKETHLCDLQDYMNSKNLR